MINQTKRNNQYYNLFQGIVATLACLAVAVIPPVKEKRGLFDVNYDLIAYGQGHSGFLPNSPGHVISKTVPIPLIPQTYPVTFGNRIFTSEAPVKKAYKLQVPETYDVKLVKYIPIRHTIGPVQKRKKVKALKPYTVKIEKQTPVHHVPIPVDMPSNVPDEKLAEIPIIYAKKPIDVPIAKLKIPEPRPYPVNLDIPYPVSNPPRPIYREEQNPIYTNGHEVPAHGLSYSHYLSSKGITSSVTYHGKHHGYY